MNTKQLLVAIAVAAAMSATAVMAQSTSAPASATPAAATATADNHKGRHGMKFEDLKAKILKRLEERAAKLQQQQACVQAASDRDALKACSPKRGKGKGGWHKRGSKGGDKAGGGASAAPEAAPAPAGK